VVGEGGKKKGPKLEKSNRSVRNQFNMTMELLKTSTNLNTRLAAKTHLADGKFLLAAKNKEFLKLQVRYS
jgi:hypothetical protein